MTFLMSVLLDNNRLLDTRVVKQKLAMGTIWAKTILDEEVKLDVW